MVLLQLVARSSDGRHGLIVVQERERVKEGVVCAVGGMKKGTAVRVGDACMRARGGVLAATRVVEREISRKREETKKREVTSPQGP